MEDPVYFLVRYDIGYFTCYARGISILNIQNLSEFCIMRFYPLPSKNLTHHIITLQQQWRKKRQYRKWCGNPLRLHYREQNGRFPPILSLIQAAPVATYKYPGHCSTVLTVEPCPVQLPTKREWPSPGNIQNYIHSHPHHRASIAHPFGN